MSTKYCFPAGLHLQCSGNWNHIWPELWIWDCRLNCMRLDNKTSGCLSINVPSLRATGTNKHIQCKHCSLIHWKWLITAGVFDESFRNYQSSYLLNCMLSLLSAISVLKWSVFCVLRACEISVFVIADWLWGFVVEIFSFAWIVFIGVVFREDRL